MIIRYHVTAKYIPGKGMRTHERGIGSLLHLNETESMRDKAMKIAKKIPYTTISICAPRGEDKIANVYVRSPFGQNKLHLSYSKRLDDSL